MAKEIERKFLVDPARLGALVDGTRIRQGFINTSNRAVVRVRLAGQGAWLTLKGRSEGAVRTEFEYEIPIQDAQQIIEEMCDDRVVTKTRFRRDYADHLWEIDVFEGANAGLIVAEVELAGELDNLQLPDWVTGEVTGDQRYYNVNLQARPYSEWGQN
jgi:adenylate cyclase